MSAAPKKTSSFSPRRWRQRLAIVFLLSVTLPLGAQEEVVSKQPGKPLLSVEVKSGFFLPSGNVNVFNARDGRYFPAGTPNLQGQIVASPAPYTETQILSIVLRNRSAKELGEIKVEYAMFKLDRAGDLKRITKGAQKLTMAQHDITVLVAQGSYTTNPREEFSGWSVKIFSEGEPIYEKYNPPSLKNTDPVKPK